MIDHTQKGIGGWYLDKQKYAQDWKGNNPDQTLLQNGRLQHQGRSHSDWVTAQHRHADAGSISCPLTFDLFLWPSDKSHDCTIISNNSSMTGRSEVAPFGVNGQIVAPRGVFFFFLSSVAAFWTPAHSLCLEGSCMQILILKIKTSLNTKTSHTF